jgi:hypothetical protein
MEPIRRVLRTGVFVTHTSEERQYFLTSFRLLDYLKKKVSDSSKLSIHDLNQQILQNMVSRCFDLRSLSVEGSGNAVR